MSTWQQNASHVLSLHTHHCIRLEDQDTRSVSAANIPPPGWCYPSCWTQLLGDGVPCHRVMSVSGPWAGAGHRAPLMATCQKLSQIVEISQNWGDYPDGAAQDRVGVLSSDGGPTGNHCVTKVSISLIENVEECEMKIDENKSLISVRCSAPPWHPAPMLSPDMMTLTDCPLSNVNNMKGVSENLDTTDFSDCCRPLLYG